MSRSNSTAKADGSRWGHFSGGPMTIWLTEAGWDRKMELADDFTFHDTRRNRTWTAKAGMTFDGASIPRSLWTIAGSPYAGDYRRAAVVHDQACKDHPREGPGRRDGDRMFMRACMAGGCSWSQSKMMYLAVRIGSLRTLFSKADDAMPAEAVWLDGPPPEQARDAETFRDIARILQSSKTMNEAEDPDIAADEIDALLVAHGYPAA